MEADFPYARTLIVVRNCRTVKKTGETTTEPHYYLSSLPPDQYQPSQWLKLIRGHWAGVEIRNHWRRDVLLGEDGSRSRNANLLANLALLRSALLSVLADQFADQSLPQIREQLNSCLNQTLKLLSS
jgi:predicted transposase YbfD/YdcC